MTLSPGSRLGAYEVIAKLGEGGMGEVYRARDTRLDRDVALKILPESFAGDPDRLMRFEREAKTLASLNHSHIAQIYGFENGPAEAGHHSSALVMELVEGEDLSTRIARGPIPLDEALPIAIQIAQALDAAHEQGIIHRDLKPANVKVRPDGTVKVLDFGLAKAIERSEGDGFSRRHVEGSEDAKASSLQTITTPAMTHLRQGYGGQATELGIILGTASYMSPEQAKGKPVDKRTDIWAFGCVLFEMLAGRRPFEGDDVTDVLGAVVRLEPDWNALAADLPPAINTLLRGCLVKDRGHRIADVSTIIFVLSSVDQLAVSSSPRPLPRQAGWRSALLPVVVAIAVAAIAFPAAWIAMRPEPAAPGRVSRFQLTSSGATGLSINGNDRDIAITPDGSKVIYVGNNGTQLFVRALDALEPSAIYTGAPRSPFVSPDGAWIGFVDANLTVKKIAITGGPAATLGTIQGTAPRGATWGQDDSVITAGDGRGAGLLRIPSGGGPSTVVTTPDLSKDEADHLWPEWLPGGRGVLFTITSLTAGLDAAVVALLDPDSGAYRILIRGGSHAHYIPIQADAGYLVYSAGGALRAIAFDLNRLEPQGTSIPVVTNVQTSGFGGLDAVVAGDGTLAYVPSDGLGAARTQFTLVWVDRQNRESPIAAPERFYQIPRLSPDGTRIAVIANDQNADLWVWDVVRTTFTRVTVDSAYENYPVWTPDGRRLIFSSDRAGTRNLFVQAADGTGVAEQLLSAPEIANASSTTPDGSVLLFTQLSAESLGDVMQISLHGSRVVTPLVKTPFNERNGTVSPDGRWLMYEADDSGRFEVYVRPYPAVNSGRWQVSTNGGARPLWGPDGRELFYVLPGGELMRAAVLPSPSWSTSPPEVLIKAGYVTNLVGQYGRGFDISPDGKRFVMIKRSGSGEVSSAASITVVLNWIEELKRLVPPNR